MNKAYQDCSENQALKFPSIPSDLNLLVSKTGFDNPCNSSIEQVMNSFSLEHCRKSETNPCFSPEADLEVHRSTYLKKSQSLASGLDRKREVSSDDEAEDEIDHGFSCEESHVKNSAKTFYSQNAVELFESNNHGKFEGNGGMVRGESIFSIGDEKHVEEERHEDFSPQLTSEHASDLGQTTPATATHVIEKSSSLPNVRILLHASEEGSQVSPSRAYIRRRSRSFEGLDALNAKRKEVLNEVGFHANEDEERENNLWESGKIEFENDLGGGYGSNNFSGLERDETLSGRSDPNGDVMNNRGRQSLDESCKELPSTDFKIKRIEEWVSQIDLGESSPLLDTSEPFESNGKAKKVPSVSAAIVSTGKLDLKANHGMEAAKNYISSLTATSTAAQLANLGLVAIPFLSAFVSLKVLNLSGNGIVRITAGALPRGLHVLNLAKNNISTIEGLRELVRLRVLDLSYNRILRVGHGLASCSSLKELYLAGNKISEVEGLHRLLKLNILDLRFNKISTAKCLSQLAANYVSLQSLNLEGNPAQRNVGDEHLKKYLHGLLPHLVYYNKQQIKVGSLKEVAERQGRSTVTAHSSDRSLRSEHKLVRKGNHNAISKGLPSSSSHGVRGHSVRSPMQSKDHYHGRLPPAGTKGPHHNRHHFLDIGSKWLNLRPVAASIHRSRSEGHLGFA